MAVVEVGKDIEDEIAKAASEFAKEFDQTVQAATDANKEPPRSGAALPEAPLVTEFLKAGPPRPEALFQVEIEVIGFDS